MRPRGSDVESIAALGDPVRRALYDCVAAAGRPVGRDEAARVVGVKRALAAYHLDRLADSGLLQVSYERPPGRRGPGAGRPGKLYERSARDVEVSLPGRTYGVAATVLAEAIEDAGAATARDCLGPAAERLGREVGAAAAQSAAPPDLSDILASRGYEPVCEPDGTIRLRNCPFHRLAMDHTALICGMNLSMLTGLCDAAASGARPVLEPTPGSCCVAILPPGLPEPGRAPAT